MNENIMKLWVDRLRTTKDKQGRVYLEKDDKRDCLCILCYLGMENGVEIKTTKDPNTKATVFNYAQTSLPLNIVAWAGLKGHNGTFKGGRLDRLNDDGKTFIEIADIIQNNWNDL